MSNIVDKLKNFWLGSEEISDDGFDQLFKLSTNGNNINNNINNYSEGSEVQQPRRINIKNQNSFFDKSQDIGESSQENYNNNYAGSKIVGSSVYSATNEVVVLEPLNFNQAVDVVKHLKKGSSIVLNLGKLEEEQSQRLLDFACGAIYALNGSQKRVGDAVFLLVPSCVNINSICDSKDSKISKFWN